MSMNSKVLVAFLLAVSCNSIAAENLSKEERQQLADTKLAQQFEDEENSPFELDPIAVTRGDLSFDEELTLRIVRQAFNEVPSNKQKDIDKLLCWIEKPIGSRISKLGCARNGDVWALRPDNLIGGNLLQTAKYAAVGYGEIMIASRPMGRVKLKRILAALPGTDAFDKEFIDLAVKGVKPPRDIPNEKEMEQFAKAWLEVKRLHKQRKSEDTQIAAINAENLTLKRYNRIAELTETYKSIKKDIASQVELIR